MSYGLHGINQMTEFHLYITQIKYVEEHDAYKFTGAYQEEGFLTRCVGMLHPNVLALSFDKPVGETFQRIQIHATRDSIHAEYKGVMTTDDDEMYFKIHSCFDPNNN